MREKSPTAQNARMEATKVVELHRDEGERHIVQYAVGYGYEAFMLRRGFHFWGLSTNLQASIIRQGYKYSIL